MARAWDTCSEGGVDDRWYPAIRERRMSLDPAYLGAYMRRGSVPAQAVAVPAIQVDPASPSHASVASPAHSSQAPAAAPYGDPFGVHYYESPIGSEAQVVINPQGVHELDDHQWHWGKLPGYHGYYDGGHGLSPQGSPAHSISSGISDLPVDDFSPDDSLPCQEAQSMVRYGASPPRARYNVPPMGSLTSYGAARYGPMVRRCPPLAGSPRRSRALSSPMRLRRSPPTPRRRFPCIPCRRC